MKVKCPILNSRWNNLKWGGITTPFHRRDYRMIIKNPYGKSVLFNKIVEADGKEKLLLQVSRNDEYQISLTFDESETQMIIDELSRLFPISKNVEPLTQDYAPITIKKSTNEEDDFYRRWKERYGILGGLDGTPTPN